MVFKAAAFDHTLEECAENMSFRVDKAWRQRCSQRFRNILVVTLGVKFLQAYAVQLVVKLQANWVDAACFPFSALRYLG